MTKTTRQPKAGEIWIVEKYYPETGQTKQWAAQCRFDNSNGRTHFVSTLTPPADAIPSRPIGENHKFYDPVEQIEDVPFSKLFYAKHAENARLKARVDELLAHNTMLEQENRELRRKPAPMKEAADAGMREAMKSAIEHIEEQKNALYAKMKAPDRDGSELFKAERAAYEEYCARRRERDEYLNDKDAQK